MNAPISEVTLEQWERLQLADELQNFKEIVSRLIPSSGDVPEIPGIEIAGLSMPMREIIGGDHVIYLDFNRRYDLEARAAQALKKGRPEVAAKLRGLRNKAGILVADVSGHRMTDALIAAMLHQAFLLGAYYELDRFGEITTRIFEHINARFYRTTTVNKYFTMMYGEIETNGKFRFLSAGHPHPAVFSREYAQFVSIRPNRMTTFPPIGLFPSVGDPEPELHVGLEAYKESYQVNEIDLLSVGDILLLYTDGLSEHLDNRYLKDRLEPLLALNRNETAESICALVRDDLVACGPVEDDVSLIVVRRTPVNCEPA